MPQSTLTSSKSSTLMEMLHKQNIFSNYVIWCYVPKTHTRIFFHIACKEAKKITRMDTPEKGLDKKKFLHYRAVEIILLHNKRYMSLDHFVSREKYMHKIQYSIHGTLCKILLLNIFKGSISSDWMGTVGKWNASCLWGPWFQWWAPMLSGPLHTYCLRKKKDESEKKKQIWKKFIRIKKQLLMFITLRYKGKVKSKTKKISNWIK